ncbi:hypothetical protein [Arthrobacter sp. NPDC090010]
MRPRSRAALVILTVTSAALAVSYLAASLAASANQLYSFFLAALAVATTP